MNWLKRKKQNEDVSYWQTLADALAALLMIVLLVLMLLILYIVRIPPEELADIELGNSFLHTMPTAGAGASGYGHRPGDNTPSRYDEASHINIVDIDAVEKTERDVMPTEPTIPRRGEGDGNDKAAVYVTVLDSETERTIKEAGIRFELYDSYDSLQTLKTYYPQKTEYRLFDTTADGVLYLPEKIPLGDYSFREISAPKGYDLADSTRMHIQESADWSDPYVIKVHLSPSRNIIRLQLKDADTMNPVGGGEYEVVAAEDIVTADGTIRYTKDSVACTIVCDGKGYGESIELYLGRYYLREVTAPRYYAKDLELTAVSVDKKLKNAKPVTNNLTNSRTKVVVTLSDALYQNLPISDAEFRIMQDGSSGKPKTLSTDEFGQIALTDLNRNASYIIRQMTTKQGYTMVSEPIRFFVSDDGRVDGEAFREIRLDNRILRAAIAVRGAVLRNSVSDYNVALYDGNGELTAVWDSSGMPHTVEGLVSGDYYIRVNGQQRNQMHIFVGPEKEVQSFSYTVWTPGDVGAAATLVLLLIGLAVVVTVVVRKKRKLK